MLKVIYVVGNISSGKTTLVKALTKYFKVYEEPISEWQTHYVLGDKNILELFYENMAEFSFKFEMVSLVSRYRQLMTALSDSKHNRVVVIERSYMCCRRVFAQNLYDQGLIDELEWKIYTEAHAMYEELIKRVLEPFRPVYLYLRTPPEECYVRKVGRARVEETTATPQYLVDLHRYHEEWFETTPCITIDGNQPAEMITKAALDIINGLTE